MTVAGYLFYFFQCFALYELPKMSLCTYTTDPENFKPCNDLEDRKIPYPNVAGLTMPNPEKLLTDAQNCLTTKAVDCYVAPYTVNPAAADVSGCTTHLAEALSPDGTRPASAHAADCFITQGDPIIREVDKMTEGRYIKDSGVVALAAFFGSWFMYWLGGKYLTSCASKEIGELEATIEDEKAKFREEQEAIIDVGEQKLMKEKPADYQVGPPFCSSGSRLNFGIAVAFGSFSSAFVAVSRPTARHGCQRERERGTANTTDHDHCRTQEYLTKQMSKADYEAQEAEKRKKRQAKAAAKGGAKKGEAIV